MIKRLTSSFAVLAASLAVGFPVLAQETLAQSKLDAKLDLNKAEREASSENSGLGDAQGMITLDYQVIPVPGIKSIDLMGFHVFTKMNDWMYLGVGGHAPLLKGEYGGFMVFDVTAHVQRQIYGNIFANAGVSLGGGGGGKSVQQSRVLSGTGGFVKTYIGLGYDFDGFSLGANIAKTKFIDSAINNSQLNVFVQVPFSYSIGDYASAGRPVFSAGQSSARGGSANSSESIMALGLDNLVQIDPEGLVKDDISLVDIQYSRFMTENSYWFFNAGGGYRGRPLYNQALGGVGYRKKLSPRVNLYSQLAIGSGGYAPETINTGPGLLVYPKVAAEYMINKDLGVSLFAGYLFAPKGSSKNYTFGAALNYHIHSGDGSSSASSGTSTGVYKGYRFNVFQQTETNVNFRSTEQPDIKLLSMQIDSIVNENVYIPVQVGVAYNPYLGFPGYGEILAGVGLQKSFGQNNRFQAFGQLLVGANVHGAVLKTGLGLNYALNDKWALYGVAGQTLAGLGSNKEKFSADYLGLGLTYRFSLPSW